MLGASRKLIPGRSRKLVMVSSASCSFVRHLILDVEIEVPYDTLIAPRAGGTPGRPGPSVPSKNYGDAESASISSFHTASKGGPSARGSTTDLTNPNKKETTPSMHSLSRASVSSARPGRRPSLPSAPPPAPSATSRNQPAARLKPILSSRVQSTVSQPSNSAPSIKGSDGRGRQSNNPSDSASVRTSYTRSTPPGTPKSPAAPLPGLQTPPADEHPLPARPKSTVSVKSTTSTIKRGNAKATLAPPSTSPNRPMSSASTRSDASSVFRSKPPVVSSKATPRKAVSQERPPRERTLSTASTTSTKSNATAGRARVPSGERLTPGAPQMLRPRRSSATSTSSMTSPKPSTTPKSSTRRLPPTPNGDMAPKKSINGLKSSASNASMRSKTEKGRPPLGLDLSSVEPVGEGIGIQLTEPDTPATSGEEDEQEHPSPIAPPAYTRIDTSPSPNRNLVFPIPPADLKGKGKADPNINPYASLGSGSHVEEDRPVSTTSSVGKTRSDGGSTVKMSRDEANMTPTDTRRRRNSGDTITESTASTLTSHNTIRAPKRPAPSSNLSRSLPPPPPAAPTPKRGITLSVGIPCIITSKRSRFRAFAKYIGEVEGERGPWVGVEIPVGGSWGGEKLAGRSWNDGTVNGTKYFEMSVNMPEWDEGEQRAARRRRIDMLLSDKGSRKREGDHLSTDRERMKRMRSVSPAMSDTSATGEVRGLFVRPQQVIYVVDAEH